MEKKLDIYKMELHQSFYIENRYKVFRVPGGWIYTEYVEYSDIVFESVFVPYNLEFYEPKK